MLSPTDPEPDPSPVVFQVGQDAAGHWLVQESDRRIEGRFISFKAALAFARSEQGSFPGATIVLAQSSLVPIVSFAPLQPWEMAGPRATDAPAMRVAA